MNNCRHVKHKKETLTFGMDSSQVGVLKERDEVSLGGFLQSHYSGGLEAKIGLKSHGVRMSHKAVMGSDLL